MGQNNRPRRAAKQRRRTANRPAARNPFAGDQGREGDALRIAGGSARGPAPRPPNLATPALPPALPAAPRVGADGPSAADAGIDDRMLAKVRALLAKAESTEFTDEADALTAKAQELMTRYSIDRALVDHDPTAVESRR